MSKSYQHYLSKTINYFNFSSSARTIITTTNQLKKDSLSSITISALEGQVNILPKKIANDIDLSEITQLTITIYPPKYYLPLKTIDYNKWKERWEAMLWEIKEEYSHMDFTKFPISLPADRGKLFKIVKQDQDSEKGIEPASAEDIEDSNIWIMPGALSTARKTMSIALQDVSTWLNKYSTELNIERRNFRPLIICPYATGVERYKSVMTYGIDKKNYYSPAIETFTRQHVIPRLLRNKPLLFITHSMGGREVSMMENAARDILEREYNLSQENIKALFENFQAICFGHATDIVDLPVLRFKKLTILSASDQGVLIPKSLYKKLYLENICKKDFYLLKVDENEKVIFLGHQNSVETVNDKINHDGHRFAHYMESSVRYLSNHLLEYLPNQNAELKNSALTEKEEIKLPVTASIGKFSTKKQNKVDFIFC